MPTHQPATFAAPVCFEFIPRHTGFPGSPGLVSVWLGRDAVHHEGATLEVEVHEELEHVIPDLMRLVWNLAHVDDDGLAEERIVDFLNERYLAL